MGNRLSVAELDSSRVTYTYDASYQLLSEQRSGSIPFATSYTYDGLGNRLSQTKDGVLTTYTHNALNAVTSATSGASVTTFYYDANGNRILTDANGALTTYTWDEENRMTGVLPAAGGRETITYSGDGERRSRSTPDETIAYVWDADNLLQELDGDGNLIAHYTDFPGYWGGLTSLHAAGSTPGAGALFNAAAFGGAMFNQAAAVSGDGSFFYLFDQSANTRFLLDSAANVSDSDLYRAFGEQMLDVGDTRNPHGFQGQVGPMTDAASRNWMRARIYDSATTGTWLSKDLIEFENVDRNFFRFVLNNPIVFTDPDGEQPYRNYYRMAKSHPCVYRSRAYCEAASNVGQTGPEFGYTNQAKNCFCSVSSTFCLIIQNKRFDSLPGFKALRPTFDCINRCLFVYWRQRNTKEWAYAEKICSQCGEKHLKCCRVSIAAEQAAFTKCAVRCKRVVKGYGMPFDLSAITRYLPGIFEGASFRVGGNQTQRTNDGQRLCCGKGSVWGGKAMAQDWQRQSLAGELEEAGVGGDD